MKLRLFLIAGLVAAGAVAALGSWSPALAQQKGSRLKGQTPANFPYEIRNGRRVPRGTRITAADGSWREEIRNGPCVTLRQKAADGEYRETRKCD